MVSAVAACASAVALALLAASRLHAAEPTPSPFVPLAAEPGAADRAAAEAPGAGIAWKQGLFYQLSDPGPIILFGTPVLAHGVGVTGRLSARLQVDAAAFAPAAGLTDVSDGIGVRRFFLNTTGQLSLGRPIDFKLELGVDENRFYLDNFYLRLTDLPVLGAFTIGVFGAPMSLDDRTSSDDRTFMESASPVEAFAPGTKAGLQVSSYRADERATWAVGWFANAQTNPVGDATESFSRLVGRITWLARDDQDAPEPRFVHLGLSASYVFSNHEAVQYQSRPESFLAPTLVDTGDLDARNAFPLGAELAAVRGPLSLQAEYLGSFVSSSALADPIFAGGYGYVSYVLTGESRPYDRQRGVFGRIAPRAPLALCPWRPGAWEIATRYSYLDLQDGPVHGGRMGIAMTGLTWYWNRYVRWMFEYGFARVRGGPTPGDLHIFQLRCQLTV